MALDDQHCTDVYEAHLAKVRFKGLTTHTLIMFRSPLPQAVISRPHARCRAIFFVELAASLAEQPTCPPQQHAGFCFHPAASRHIGHTHTHTVNLPSRSDGSLGQSINLLQTQLSSRLQSSVLAFLKKITYPSRLRRWLFWRKHV